MSSDTPKVDIRALASLARVDISDAEVAKLETELPSILAFVETIQKADVSQAHNDTSLRNVLRADENPHESGIYTEALLSAAPAREGDRIAVKQVISRKNKEK
jgi:aspartyl-tRNA(Asn)/glutamyl-tRNA(Gln) amidotransferase subunit C